MYFSANVFQGYFEPLTPMGMQFFQLLGASIFRSFGARVADPVAGPSALIAAGMRLYLDVTPVMRDRLGRGMFTAIMSSGESRSSVVLSRLGSDPRLSQAATSRLTSLRRIVAGLVRVGIPHAALLVLLRPAAARARHEIKAALRRCLESALRAPISVLDQSSPWAAQSQGHA